MDNYIMINGQKISLTNKQIKEIQKSFKIGNTVLKSVAVGDTFKIGDYEFVVLEHSKETTAVILKNLLHDSEEFGENNNYDSSNVDKLCQSFGKEISNIIGANNLIEHTVDLTSGDGIKDYGTIKRCMSLMTAELYRRYVYVLDKHKISSWWWLSTAFSTPTHNDKSWILCVSPIGYVNYGSYDYGSGVRPFCILNSNIFVSNK